MTARLLRPAPGRAVGVTVQGDPRAEHTVLLCHPSPGASGFDPDPAATAAKSVRIVTADRPGYGASTPADAAIALRDPLAAELAAFDELTSDGTPVDGIVGWGFGGLAALRIAAARPADVSRVVIVQTPRASSRVYAVTGRRARAWIPQHVDPLDARAAVLGGTRIGSLSVLGAHDDDEALKLPGLRERLEHMLDLAVRQGEAGVDFDLHAGKRRDWPAVLRSIRAPVLVLYGERDPRVSIDDAKWFARHLPDPVIELVREAGPLAIASEWGRILDFVAVRQERR